MEIFLFPNVNASSCPFMPACLSVYMKVSLTLLSEPLLCVVANLQCQISIFKLTTNRRKSI
ncbi:hypothetical protein Fmac_029092 [Flemingia macrophylla]|uniref:Uncharacterized protein n=1 Tax=Flemingia macrophylla TaxID=520843 RepID=A0ABD1L9P9_9FABA